MPRHLRPVPDGQPLLDACVDVQPAAPLPTAGDLVKAWCAAYTHEHGSQPHPGLVRRVAGSCKTLGKDCETVEHWRDAWLAAAAAGREGRFDVVPYLVPGAAQQRRQGRNGAASMLARLEAAEALEVGLRREIGPA